MDGRLTTIELCKEDMKFSAGHFTIFSATERENMHGHNFNISVALTGAVGRDGLMANYGPIKGLVRRLCASWNETFLLPGASPHLRVEQAEDEVRACFADEVLRFLPRDVTVMPIANVTIEELARHFGETLVAELGPLIAQGVVGLRVRCASGPGQWGSWDWALVVEDKA